MEGQPQREVDKNYIQDLLDNNTQVVELGFPERKREVVDIVQRAILVAQNRERGGPTKEMLLQLKDLCPDGTNVNRQMNKIQVLQVLLTALQQQEDEEVDGEDDNEQRAPAGNQELPVGQPPEGWGQFMAPRPIDQPPQMSKPMLKLKRGLLDSFSKENCYLKSKKN